jgi:transposase InsO family protein
MGQKDVSMEIKYAAVFASVLGNQESVTTACARLGISRTSFYKYRARFAAEGLDGLQARSRRPHKSPRQTAPEMVALILAARVHLEEEGWDSGALSILFRLLREGHDPPSWRTIHRVLVREGRVEPQPQKKPRSAYRRFEFPAPDDCWQIDAFDYRLLGGELATVFEVKDDCSRTQIANLAWPAEETTGAWECLARGIDDFDLPYLVLSDNSLAFTGKIHHRVVLVEKNLAALGIKLITSRPRHPQTCGKNERGHQTLQRWLAAQPQAATLAELQTLLDRYQQLYNNRPHQGLDHNQTPLERRIAAARHTPRPRKAVSPTIVRHATVKARGYLSWDGYHIAIGRELAGRTLLVFATGDHLVIFYRHHLVRELTLDRTRHYQSRPEPRRRDANRDRLQHDHDAAAARDIGQAPGLPLLVPAGGRRGSGSRAAPGRRAAIASATLEAEKWPLYDQRGGTPAITNPLSAMS